MQHGSFRLDVITALNDGLNPSFIITTKGIVQSQYVFHVPEGFSRFALEHRLRPGLGLRAVFLSELGHGCHGLPGLLMRLRGDGHGSFELFGPASTLAYVEALPHVCSWKNPAVLVTHVGDSVYEDENVVILPIYNDTESPSYNLRENSFDRATVLEQLTSLVPHGETLEHNVYGRLYHKKDETARYGNIWARKGTDEGGLEPILGYICRIKSSHDTIIVSGYLSDVSHVEAMLSHATTISVEIDSIMKDSKVLVCLACTETCRNGINVSKCVHGRKNMSVVVLNTVGSMVDMQPHLGYDSTAKISSKLHTICPHMFPLPYSWKYLRRGDEHAACAVSIQGGEVMAGVMNYACSISPAVDSNNFVCDPYISSSQIISIEKLSENQVLNEKVVDVAMLESLKQQVAQVVKKNSTSKKSNSTAAEALKQRLLLNTKRKHHDTEEREKSEVYAASLHGPYVFFLGTGSAEPSKYRGPSGILIKIPTKDGKADAGYILLECGEGTFGQLVRFFGYEGAVERISKIQFIWISHRHADHMSGLVELLSRRGRRAEEVFLLGPKSCIRWILSIKKVADLGRFRIEHILNSASSTCNQVMSNIQATMRFTPVRHCSDAYAISIIFSNSFKLVYSGDTEPCEALVEDGQGADLLIHEATFEPEMIHDARKKKHSTISEAIDIANRMNAKRTILTHFSQRYPKFPKGLPDNKAVGVAFDGFCMPLATMEFFPQFVPFMQQMLEEQELNK